MAKVILICGKICSGKSYYANSIKEKENAIVLSVDEITFDLFDNKLGQEYEMIVCRIKNYLMKKASEIIMTGCNVILDWGFWSKDERIKIKDYFAKQEIDTEWHYIDVDDETWQKNISERNERVLLGNGGCNFFVDEGLLHKLALEFEEPYKEEMRVIYKTRRI